MAVLRAVDAAPDKTPEELVAEWIGSLRAEGKSPRTVESYPVGVLALLERTGGEMPTRRDVRSYVASQLERNSAGTAIVRLRGIKSFFHYLLAEGEIAEDPSAGVREPATPQKPTRVLTDGELRRLLATCERHGSFHAVRDAAILRLFVSTGMRLSELADLRPEDLDLERGRAVVRRGKGGKARVVAVPPRALQALLRYLRCRRDHRFANLPGLWIGKDGQATADSIYKMCRRRAREAGIGDLHPHALRHLYAHKFLAAGGSEGDLMKLCGWTSSKMLQRYGAALASERALASAARLRVADDV